MYNNGAVVEVNAVSKWFGTVVAVSDLSVMIEPGITGILGPNGAGKTTLLRMICGLSAPSEGEIRLFGDDPRSNHAVYKRISVMSEHDAVYEFMTGSEFVRLNALLKDADPSASNIARAVDEVAMGFAAERKIATYSRGMRQRIRLAAALVSDPDLLILDEPLNGADPTQRINFQDVLLETARRGKSIIISSHILEEVETVASSVLLIVAGKLAAAGDHRAIRRALSDRPYNVSIASSDTRVLASALVGLDSVVSLQFESDGTMIALTSNVSDLQEAVARVAKEHDITLSRFEPIDDSLESVFEYLVQ